MRVNLLRSKSQLVRNFIFKQDGIRGKLSLEATMLFILKQKKSCPKILNGKIMVTRWSQLFRLRTLVNTPVCLRLVKLLALLLSKRVKPTIGQQIGPNQQNIKWVKLMPFRFRESSLCFGQHSKPQDSQLLIPKWYFLKVEGDFYMYMQIHLCYRFNLG